MSAELSAYLDEMAREAGIPIQRYQNPIDVERTRQLQKTNPTTTPAKSTTTTQTTKPSSQSQQQTGNNKEKASSKYQQGFKNAISNEESKKPQNQNQSASTTTKPNNNKQQSIQQATNNKPTTTTTTTTKTPQKKDEKATNLSDYVQPFNPNTLINVAALDEAYDKESQRLEAEKNKDTQEEEHFDYKSRQKKASEFFTIIETHLAPKLKVVQKQRDEYATLLHELEQLTTTIHALQLSHDAGQKTTESKVDLGAKILADAKFVNTGKIVIDLGLNVWAEMPYAEALVYIQERHAYYLNKLDNVEQSCCLWSARIKAMHEAIGVLTEITEQDPEYQEKMNRRQISFGL